MIVLNVLFAWLGWQWAKEAFEEGRNGWGWFNLFASAANAAAVAAVLV